MISLMKSLQLITKGDEARLLSLLCILAVVFFGLNSFSQYVCQTKREDIIKCC